MTNDELYQALQDFKQFIQDNFPFKQTTFSGTQDPSDAGLALPEKTFFIQIDRSGAVTQIYYKQGPGDIDWHRFGDVLSADLSASTGADMVGYGSETVASKLLDLANSVASGLTGGAPMWGSIGEGLDNTAVDQFFTVPGTGDDYSTLYRHDPGDVATEISRAPSTQSVQFLRDSIVENAPDNFAWTVTDEFGRAALGLRQSGIAKIAAQELPQRLSNGDDFEPAPPAGLTWAIVDALGRASIGILPDGTVKIGALEVVGEASIPGLDPEIAPPPSIRAELNHFISYGQSLSVGSQGRPVLSTSQPYDSLRFVGGVRTRDGGGPTEDDHASLIPLVEQESGTMGETPVSGACNHAKALIAAESPELAGITYRLLGSAPGFGGRSVQDLSKGSEYYQWLLDDVTFGLARAGEIGLSYAVSAVSWTQGERDYAIDTGPVVYKALLEQLVSDVRADARSITGVGHDVPWVSYQIGSHLHSYEVYGYENCRDAAIARVQLEMGLNNPGFYLATPTYMMTYVDNIHMDNASYKWMGAYYGLVYKRVVIDGLDWLPLHPVAFLRQGSMLMIRFHVPVGALTVDTTQVASNAHYGFRIWDDSGTEIPITSVSIASPDTIKILCSATIPAGSLVRYALDGDTGSGSVTGARGNLRDSQGDSIVFDPTGINRRMDNWCVMFQETI